MHVTNRRAAHGAWTAVVLLAAVLIFPQALPAQDVGGATTGAGGIATAPSASTDLSGMSVGGAPAIQTGGMSIPGSQALSNGPLPLGNPEGQAAGNAGLSATQIQSMLGSPEVRSILNNPAALSNLSQKFGISPTDILSIRNQLTSGGLPEDQMNKLAARLGAIQASPAEMVSIAHALGLSEQQIAQIQSMMGGKQSQPNSAQTLPVETQQGGPAPQQVSSIESKFRSLDLPGQMPSTPDLSGLNQFGYSLFAAGVSTFAPVSNVPVGDDYIIGPGDQLVVLEWGRVSQNLQLTVDRDGSIQLPQVGPVQVAGLSFVQAKKLLEDRLQRFEGVKANVTMGQLRTIQVFVVGQVNRPGTYTISSLSHISNALQAAGGISKVGSLRHVELRRGNQVIDVMDLYDLLVHGDSGRDLRLDNNDVIFVPVIGPVVAVAGDVKVPAIYELGRGAPPAIMAVLKMAGGVTAFGYSERVQVERVEKHASSVVLDVNLEQAASRRFAIRDGDVIKVYGVLPEHTNTVILSGNVHRPGEYQWYSGMHISDLIGRGQGILPHTYFRYALIKRLTGAQKYTHYIPVNLGDALSGGPGNPANLLLKQRDELVVFSQDQLRDMPHVTIVGQVRNPGQYPLTEKMRLSDLIYQAGGLRDDANKTEAELARTQVGSKSNTHHIYMRVSLPPVLTGDASRDIVLKNNDQVFIRTASNWYLPMWVKVAGQVMRPGPYAIRPGERLSSVLARCGGLRSDAYPQGMILIRESVQQVEQERINQARARLSQQMAQYSLTLPLMSAQGSGASGGGLGAAAAGLTALQQLLATASSEQADGRVVVHFTSPEELANSPEDIPLEKNDSITIPRRPSTVNILGQVNTPVSIAIRPGATVGDYLYRAGGPTANGDIRQLMVVKADGSVITQAGLNNAPKAGLFPLLRVTSPRLMDMPLDPGDTIYVPENLADIPSYLRLTETKDITTIIAQSVTSLAIIGVLASNL